MTEFEYSFIGKESGVPIGFVMTQDEAHRLIASDPEMLNRWYLVKRPRTHDWEMVAPEIQSIEIDDDLKAWQDRIHKKLDALGPLEPGI